MEKTLLIDALRPACRLIEPRACLGILKSSYFYCRLALRREDKYAEVSCLIARLFDGNGCCYGFRRMHSLLGREGLKISEKVVRRIMSKE
ncbi:MAG: IS3 family transposase [Coriobacteriia bacterium]|nr:IS3 family transposase [Coriobacteriia bacterium]